MSNETNKSLPMYRFPEFKNSGYWNIKPLGRLLEIANGKDYKHLSKGLIPVYGSGGYMFSVDDYLCDGESVCIGRKGTIDKPMFLTGKFWAVDTLFYTHSFNNCLPKFIYYAFQNVNWLSYNEAGGVPSLTKATISKIELFAPELVEQKKIADCLSSLDELVSAETEKLAQLKIYKKGLMQLLFPAEGKTVPELRFPEFADSGEWNIELLGNVFKNESSTLAQNKIQFIENGYPVYGADGFIGFAGFYIQGEDYIAMIKDGSGVGKLFKYQQKSSVLGTLNYLKSQDNDKYDLTYLFYLLQTINFSSYIKGGGIPHIYYSDYSLALLAIPDIYEQQKIANCLSVLDTQAVSIVEKINALKQHKKGLLQQLFPTINQVEDNE